MTKTETKTTLIETTRVEADYGMLCTIAIVEHPKHGRLFIREGYGGEDSLAGGAIRWKHGIAIRIQPGDTLLTISYRQRMPAWMILKANPGMNAEVIHAGAVINIPSLSDLLPLPVVMDKRIRLSISTPSSG